MDSLFYKFSSFKTECDICTSSSPREPSWDIEDYALAALLRYSSPKYPPWVIRFSVDVRQNQKHG
eukprot:4287854-Karenia_brevis.AAC.1